MYRSFTAPVTYPVPVMREAYNTIVGYYPDDYGLEDVAVLGVPTFKTSGSGLPDDVLYNFAVTAKWFVQCNTKFVAGYALLIVFFPNETIYSDTPFRTHEAMGFIGTIINYGNNSDNSEASNSGLVVTDLLQPDQTSTFENWNEVYGPYTEAGVPVSALMAEFDFADDANSVSDPINIDGERGELNARTPPFAPEDIIILTDGRCSSTCTILVDQMASKGVRTVAVGGRPRAGVIQANYRRYQRV
ncbi:peptidase S41 family protein [Talaromyces pinophilus]|uniref:Peptidase S41 family protein n=1 Tax=Talaromyces pinophilus TaxID=128442 RepID=A0A6V8HH04_TALPI|nr:peptidase S41 family protein [Talaromyces pinophilus]